MLLDKFLDQRNLLEHRLLGRTAVDGTAVDAVLEGHGLVHALIEEVTDSPEVPQSEGIQGLMVLDAQVDQPAHDHIGLPEGQTLLHQIRNDNREKRTAASPFSCSSELVFSFNDIFWTFLDFHVCFGKIFSHHTNNQ